MVEEKKYLYVTDQGDVSWLYCHYYLYEKFALHQLLEEGNIGYKDSHWIFYEYFLENLNLKSFEKSNVEIAKSTFLSESTIKTLKKDFEKIGILKLFHTKNKPDKFYFKRLVSICGSKINPQNNEGQNLTNRGVENCLPVGQNLTTNINNDININNNSVPNELKPYFEKWLKK